MDYITNFDLTRDASWAEKYPLFIVLGHNEYWTKEEFDAVEKRIFIQGKNTLFLGANIAYWQVRYVDINQAPGGRISGPAARLPQVTAGPDFVIVSMPKRLAI